jgi:hypothetical protein
MGRAPLGRDDGESVRAFASELAPIAWKMFGTPIMDPASIVRMMGATLWSRMEKQDLDAAAGIADIALALLPSEPSLLAATAQVAWRRGLHDEARAFATAPMAESQLPAVTRDGLRTILDSERAPTAEGAPAAR